MSEWIPVDERLPEPGVPVLTAPYSHRGLWVRHMNNANEWTWERIAPVTHWMPLPEPPDE